MKSDDLNAAMELSYFLCSRGEDPERTQHDVIVYYDHYGKRYENQVPKTTLKEALAKVDNKPKAIERSAGGLISAQPSKLLVYTNYLDKNNVPEIRLRVQFLDFFREADAPLTQERYTILTKDILPGDVSEHFSFALNSTQRFVVDFGFGIVPVFVFEYIEDAQGNLVALFAPLADVRNAAKGDPRKKVKIQCYRAYRGILRMATKLELEMALHRAKQLEGMGENVIPSCLRIGPQVEIPTGFPTAIMRDILSRVTAPYSRGKKEDVFKYMDGI